MYRAMMIKCWPTAIMFKSVLRDEWRHQNGWIFGKTANGLWPPPLVFGNFIANFFENSRLKPCIKVKNLQYKFLDCECPPATPLELFQKFVRLDTAACPFHDLHLSVCCSDLKDENQSYIGVSPPNVWESLMVYSPWEVMSLVLQCIVFLLLIFIETL